jgi:hypothetical protein
VTAEEATNQTHEEALVKVAAEAFGPSTGIHEEAPVGIFDGGASKIGQVVGPSVADGEIHKEKAVPVFTGAGAVTVANVGTKSVEGLEGGR